jgi:hypothetical protein
VPATSGEAIFARYAFPPNDLGHCGPAGSDLLLTVGAGADSSSDLGAELRHRAAQFDGAWPYLQMLAAAAGDRDPMDREVVSAYWLGGALLDRVGSARFLANVLQSFGGQPGVRERLAASPDIGAAGPSHVFHVFVVYPWVGLLGAGGDVPRSILDSCRVSWGTVESVEGEQARVRCRPLSWDGSMLGLGPERVERCSWARSSQAFVQQLLPGDQVSLHWQWICDRLDGGQVAALTDLTRRQLASTNAWLSGELLRFSERSVRHEESASG